MSACTLIRIDQTLYELAKRYATLEYRTLSRDGRINRVLGAAWGGLRHLPVSFVAESLASMAEPRDQAHPFVPRSGRV